MKKDFITVTPDSGTKKCNSGSHGNEKYGK